MTDVLLAVILAVVLAAVFGVLIAAEIEKAKAVAARPYLEQAKLASEGLTALRASSHGYTLHLVTEGGAPIGNEESGQFSSSTFRPSDIFTYASNRYEIVEVRDDWPSAVGTLVLKTARLGPSRG